MNTYMWAIPMGITAVICEALYRKLPGPWSAHLILWIPLHLIMGYLVYKVVVSGSSLLSAFVIGNFVTTTMRVAVTLIVLREPVSSGTWIALGLMVLAQFARRI